MAIQQYMGIIKVIFCILLVFNIMAVVSIDDKKTEEEFIRQLFDPTSGRLTEDTAEVLWITCWEDLIHLKKEVEDLDLFLPKESYRSTNEIGSVARENIQKLINTCYPQLKENVLHCLRKNNFPFNNVPTEEDSSKIWHATFMGSLSSRRYLGHVLPEHVSTSIKEETSSDSGKNKDTNSSGSNTVIIAVVVTFFSSALLFFCLYWLCGSGQVSQTDEKPLLSMSMSDCSIGSSSNNNLFKNSIKEDSNTLGFQSSSNSLSYDKQDSMQDSMQDTQSIGVPSIARPSFELKPPPGRVGSGIPPLKPPPGRPNLLPSDPLSIKLSNNSMVPPSSSTTPPPPPPPPPTTTTSPPPTTPPNISTNAPPPPPLPGGGPRPPPPPGGGGPTPPPPGPGAGPRPPPPPPLRGGGGGGGGPQPPPPPGAGPRAPPPPGAGPRAPPPPGAGPRAPPPPGGKAGPRPPGRGGPGAPKGPQEMSVPKAKLKPFFWDKVQANDQAMVWNQLKAGSFQFDEEMMETLFGYSAAPAKAAAQPKKEAQEPQFIQIINAKKAQNLAILLKALNVTTDEVCDALLEGNELPTEFLQTLLKMAPTQEEELKLRLYTGNLAQLGPADRFLKSIVDIPFSYKRMEALLYMGTLQEEFINARDSYGVLETACKKLRSSRLFLKLLEAVLKTGNRMNDGTFRGGAQAFKLDTLLKLSDVKGVDGKTTLLHFVVLEIMRTEGIRAARMAKENHSFSSIKTEDLLEDVSFDTEEHYRELGLQVVSRLSDELEFVKKAAILDADGLVGTTSRLGHGLIKTRDFVNKEFNNKEGDKGFQETVKSFVEKAEADVTNLLQEEKRIMALVKSTGDYFHGDTGKDEGLRLFVVVRDFLLMLDKVCKEIKATAAAPPKKPAAPPAPKSGKQEAPNHSRASSAPEATQAPNHSRASSAPEATLPPPAPDIRQKIFPAIATRRVDDLSSSDDESP
ncbi:Formin-like protein 5, partial [Mucuna pruriens]